MAVAAKTAKYTPPKSYTYRELEELWVLAGGREIEAPLAAQVATAESGGVPTAENHNTNGSTDRGLWQINSVHGALSTTNVLANAKAAVKISKEGSGWQQWVTVKTGAYQKAVTPAVQKTGINTEKAIEPEAGLLGLLEGKVPGFSKEGKTEEGLEKTAEKAAAAFSWEGLSKFAITAVLLVAGAILVVYGIMVAVRPREGALALPKMPVPVPV